MSSSKHRMDPLEAQAVSVEQEASLALRASTISSNKQAVSSREEETPLEIYSKSSRNSLGADKVSKEAHQGELSSKLRDKTLS